MKETILRLGNAYGLYLMAKAALIVVSVEAVYNVINSTTGLFFGSNPLQAGEKAIEDAFLTYAIYQFSLGIMCVVAAYFKDITFFGTSFLAFNVTYILLHGYFIYGGRIKQEESIGTIIELVVVSVIFVYFELSKTSRAAAVKVVDEAKKSE